MGKLLRYVELKTGYSDNGPAWIGLANFSKSGRTVYFNGLALKSLAGASATANYFDVHTGDEYWVSGVKKRGSNRHTYGAGPISVDEAAVASLLEHLDMHDLPRGFKVVHLKPSKPSLLQLEREHNPASDEELFPNSRAEVIKSKA